MGNFTLGPQGHRLKAGHSHVLKRAPPAETSLHERTQALVNTPALNASVTISEPFCFFFLLYPVF